MHRDNGDSQAEGHEDGRHDHEGLLLGAVALHDVLGLATCIHSSPGPVGNQLQDQRQADQQMQDSMVAALLRQSNYPNSHVEGGQLDGARK